MDKFGVLLHQQRPDWQPTQELNEMSLKMVCGVLGKRPILVSRHTQIINQFVHVVTLRRGSTLSDGQRADKTALLYPALGIVIYDHSFRLKQSELSANTFANSN